MLLFNFLLYVSMYHIICLTYLSYVYEKSLNLIHMIGEKIHCIFNWRKKQKLYNLLTSCSIQIPNTILFNVDMVQIMNNS